MLMLRNGIYTYCKCSPAATLSMEFDLKKEVM
uniref:Uncharacterized protein n=1 Tax=Anguilla anguilla TaxID=7936 RepID=A0A0E9RKX4_ANGAN